MADIATSAPNRVSRYRSQRTVQEARAQDATITPSMPVVPAEETVADEKVTRRKSRYHRVGPNAAGAQPGARPKTAPAEEAIDVVRRPSKRDAPPQPIVLANLQRKPSARRYRDSIGSPPTSPQVQPGAPDRRVDSSELNWDEEEDRRRRLQERYALKREAPSTSETQTQPTVTGPYLQNKADPVQPAPDAVRHDGPPASGDIRATRSMSALPKVSDSDEEEEDAGCFGMFKRKRIEPLPYAQEKPPLLRSKASKSKMLSSKKSQEKLTIKPGGGGVVPGFDAPVSAVNAGDRQVMVVCGKSKAMFAVTPATTPVDIMKSASKSMSQHIDVRSAVLLEDFVTVGVQRPLRRYERIRDVMNSWDTDKQNTLILVDSGSGTSEAELSVSGVPQEKPDDHEWLLEFSQRVGKWDKRIISLKSDGQITVQKDLNKSQDQTNLCHLSDFDIYRPTQEKAKKKIKPPKRYCFAIKSQQKTAMFESTHDFVHFFCTNDRPTADAFHNAIQSWRSWYLVNVMGEGRKPRQTHGALEKAWKDSGLDKELGVKDRGEKVFEAQYQVSSLKALEGRRLEEPTTTSKSRDVQASRPMKASNQLEPTISPERKAIAKKQIHPPGSMNNRGLLGEDEPLVNLGRKESVNRRRPSLDEGRSNSEELGGTGLLGREYSQRQKDIGFGRKDSVNRRRASIGSTSEEFAPSGLLGRNYSQRQRDHAERDNEQRAFNARKTLLDPSAGVTLNDGTKQKAADGVVRRHSTRAHHVRKTSAEGGGGLQRTNSERKQNQMPKPLVDLTPQYREPPQHSKKGRGFNLDKTGEGPLIDNATSPEDPLGVPPSFDWRAGRNANSSANTANAPSRNAATARSTKRPQTARDAAPAFADDGLLSGSRAQQGWGKTNQGRGIMDGSKAKGPMVDMTSESVFAHGSLVAKVEAEQGISSPIIDRSRDDD